MAIRPVFVVREKSPYVEKEDVELPKKCVGIIDISLSQEYF